MIFDPTYPVEAPPASVGSFAVFHCPRCDCTNTAWKDSDRFQAIIASGQLTRSPRCRNIDCHCHRNYAGNRLQAKLIDVGTEAPF